MRTPRPAQISSTAFPNPVSGRQVTRDEHRRAEQPRGDMALPHTLSRLVSRNTVAAPRCAEGSRAEQPRGAMVLPNTSYCTVLRATTPPRDVPPPRRAQESRAAAGGHGFAQHSLSYSVAHYCRRLVMCRLHRNELMRRARRSTLQQGGARPTHVYILFLILCF